MAFQLKYQCDNCGYEVWSSERPAEHDCPCYIPEEPCDTTLNNPINKTERKERYRIQYKLNGYSWHGSPPEMYLGIIEIDGIEKYPDRTELFKTGE